MAGSGSGRSQAEVACTWMDGRHKMALWTKATLPDSLAFSDDGATIYWADSSESELGGSFFPLGKLRPDLSQREP